MANQELNLGQVKLVVPITSKGAAELVAVCLNL